MLKMGREHFKQMLGLGNMILELSGADVQGMVKYLPWSGRQKSHQQEG